MLSVPSTSDKSDDGKRRSTLKDWSWLGKLNAAVEYGEETGIQARGVKTESKSSSESVSESDSTVAQNRLFVDDLSQYSIPEAEPRPSNRSSLSRTSRVWDESKYPDVKLLDFKDLTLNEDEINGVLSHRVVASSLSCLSQCPETNKYAYVKSTLSSSDLTNISLLEQYTHLQYIDLSWNYLTDLRPLGSITYLIYLDVSHNRLTKLLDFEAPCNLTFVNFSHNYISEIPDLTRFWSIVELNLAYNRIRKIEGLHNLKYLQKLDLSYNEIERFENLNNLNIVDLNLEDNSISSFEEGEDVGLKTLLNLFNLDISKNKLSSLKLFEKVYHLRTLKLQLNQISELSELEYFSKLVLIRDLDMRENPIVEANGFREIVIHMLPNLILLNGFKVKISEKVTATNVLIPNVFLKAAQNHAYLLLLEKLKCFDLDDIVPIDECSHPVLILVGPWGSLKSYMAKMLAEDLHDKVCKAVCHTSRPKTENEVDGVNYYFVTQQEFNKKVRDGEFLSVTAILGKSFGFSRSELARCMKTRKLILIHMDIHGALSLRCHRLNAKLVLIIPKSSDFHLERLRKKYVGFKMTKSHMGAVKIKRRSIKSYDWLEKLTNTNSALTIMEMSHSIGTDLNDIVGDSVSKAEMLLYIENNLRMLVSSIQRTALTSHNAPGLDGYFPKNEISNLMGSLFANIPDEIQIYVENYLNEFLFSLNDDQLERIRQKFSSGGSLISCEGMDEEVTSAVESNEKNSAARQELKYANYGENTFLHNVLNTRKIYFSLNQKNPGLFSATIFSDDIESAYQELHSLVRRMYHDREACGIPTYSLESHVLYPRVISSRLAKYREEIRRHHQS